VTVSFSKGTLLHGVTSIDNKCDSKTWLLATSEGHVPDDITLHGKTKDGNSQLLLEELYIMN